MADAATYKTDDGTCNFRFDGQERATAFAVETPKGGLAMGDNRTDLPEGTDTIIEGASNPDDTGSAIAETSRVTERDLIETQGTGTSSQGSNDAEGTGSGSANFIERLRNGSENLSGQVGDRARGFVAQGLDRSAEALSNVSRLVGDTAEGLDERLGPEFGEYARRAASALENTANNIASKDPDELIEDTRNFVRNSPGVAIAGAAIVGFAVARLLKSGLSSTRDDDDA